MDNNVTKGENTVEQSGENGQELISKKQLLETYGISYGALYRWKRKKLIPEEWFLKKATPTGQETFFPKTLVCERVELILRSKEDTLLAELAEKLSGEERTREAVVLDTVFGEKKFYLRDIKAVAFVAQNGIQTDITEQFLKLLGEETT